MKMRKEAEIRKEVVENILEQWQEIGKELQDEAFDERDSAENEIKWEGARSSIVWYNGFLFGLRIARRYVSWLSQKDNKNERG